MAVSSSVPKPMSVAGIPTYTSKSSDKQENVKGKPEKVKKVHSPAPAQQGAWRTGVGAGMSGGGMSGWGPGGGGGGGGISRAGLGPKIVDDYGVGAWQDAQRQIAALGARGASLRSGSRGLAGETRGLSGSRTRQLEALKDVPKFRDPTPEEAFDMSVRGAGWTNTADWVRRMGTIPAGFRNKANTLYRSMGGGMIPATGSLSEQRKNFLGSKYANVKKPFLFGSQTDWLNEANPSSGGGGGGGGWNTFRGF